MTTYILSSSRTEGLTFIQYYHDMKYYLCIQYACYLMRRELFLLVSELLNYEL